MGIQEIVAAIIDSIVLTDVDAIRAFKALGKNVRFVTRQDARELATHDPRSIWQQISDGQALFLRQGQELFRAV